MMIGFSQYDQMPDTLTISLNEFRALLRKAFEGIFGHDRDWNALTDLVIWLECHGENGLKVFLSRAGNLAQMGNAKLESETQGYIEINADRQSLLLLHNSICDVAVAEARSSGMATLQIRQAEDPSIIVATVAEAAEYGFSSAAWWPGGDGWACIATQSHADEAPCLRRINLPPDFEALNDITFVVGGSMSRIEDKYPDWFLFQKGQEQAPNEIRQLFLSHLDNGCVISRVEYEHLNRLADAVLVEATEASRQGAGPS